MEGLLIPNMDPRYAEVEWLHSVDQRSRRFNYPPLATPNSDLDKNMSQCLNHRCDIYPITLDDDYDDDLHFPSQAVNQLDYQYPPITTFSMDYPLPFSSSTTFQFRPHPLIDFPLPRDNCNSLSTCNDAVLDPVTFIDVAGTGTTTELTALESSKTSWFERDDKHHQDFKFEVEINDVGLDGNLVVKSENCHRDNVDLLVYSVEESLKFKFDDQQESGIHEVGSGQYGNGTEDVATQGNYNGKRLAEDLGFAELQKYFEMPIAVAANRLNIGLTVLKKRCRQLNIRRWPHRKIKSLKALIHNVKEMGLVTELEMLEENERMIKDMPELDLPDRTKKLRQHCFKANYKKRRTTFT